MPDQSYRPHERLRTKEQYERVLLRKCTVRGRFLLVYGCENEVNHPRLGRMVGRRWGNAVVRNKYRRWIREAFRRKKSRLPPIDLVVLIQQKLGLSYTAIEAELASLAQQAHHKLQPK